VHLGGTEERRGEVEPPYFHFTPALRSGRAAPLIKGTLYQGLRHTISCCHGEETARLALKLVPGHLSVTFLQLLLPKILWKDHTGLLKLGEAQTPCHSGFVFSLSPPIPSFPLLDTLFNVAAGLRTC